MKIAQWNYLGPRSTPHEVRTLRKESFDYHRKLGQPIVHKHRWNLKDVREGRAQMCPFHDDILESDRQWDPYCFGTGILGGWADGVITYISIADTQQDTIQIGPQGQLLLETHPAFTAPWVPTMGDDDLIILADFDAVSWEITEEHERYILREVTPVSMRGFETNRGGYKVHQQGNMDKLPYGDPYYDVPIVFDYTNVPIPPDPTPDTRDSSMEFFVKLYGDEQGTSSRLSQDVRVTALGDTSNVSVGVRVGSSGGGTNVIFEEEY